MMFAPPQEHDPAIDATLQPLWDSLNRHDPDTRDHCQRVGRLAMAFGKAAGLSPDERHQLQVSALFHDIGKLEIPDVILCKPGPLSTAERDVIRSHPAHGQALFSRSGHARAASIAEAIRHHHEAFDGSGYPDGLNNERIPTLGRMVAIIDNYDALTALRPYKQRQSHRRVMDYLESGNGTRFDPKLLRVFVKLIETSPLRAI
jgi:HD-GYP domain-containing protein (c-di-GMP phosphodiesterase class II)